jgi:hypothetical protein
MTIKTWPALIGILCGMALPPLLDAANYLFTWKASTDPSVTAYGIYQRIENADYEKIDEVAIKDLKNPNRPSYLFTGLTDGNTYWFAVTLVYLSGAESGLFNQTCIQVNGQIDDCEDDDEDDDSGTTVYITCFINAVGELFFQKTPD